jgi:AcrR family transcriptional regulator
MPRRKQRTPALRELVLTSALSTFEEVGVEGFTARKVAQDANTSVPAVYELFGDKAGLIRELFFDGWRRLRDELEGLATTDDARRDVEETIWALRRFVRGHAALAQLMFSRPFADFDPGPRDRAGGDAVRELIVDRVRRCVSQRVIEGDPTDVAHVLLAVAQGLAAQESAGWLGSSAASRDRRWALAVAATLDGLAPADPS